MGVGGGESEGVGSKPGEVLLGLFAGVVGVNGVEMAGAFGNRATSTALIVVGCVVVGGVLKLAPERIAPLSGVALNCTPPERELADEAIVFIELAGVLPSTTRIAASLLARSRGGELAICVLLPLPQVSVERASTGAGVKLPGIRMPRNGS